MEEIEFAYERHGHRPWLRARPFEGVRCKWPDKRLQAETGIRKSVREWLGAFMNMRPCSAACGGVAPEEVRSLFVRFNNKIDFRSHRNVDQAGACVFRSAEVERARKGNRPTDPQGSERALKIPRRRGSRLPHAGAHRGDAIGRRGPAYPARDANRIEPGRRAVHPR